MLLVAWPSPQSNGVTKILLNEEAAKCLVSNESFKVKSKAREMLQEFRQYMSQVSFRF